MGSPVAPRLVRFELVVRGAPPAGAAGGPLRRPMQVQSPPRPAAPPRAMSRVRLDLLPQADYWLRSGLDPAAPARLDPLQRSGGARTPDHDRYSAKRYPLLGPILATARVRELKGICSQCRTRLSAKVAPPAVLVCPVCGHHGRVGAA